LISLKKSPEFKQNGSDGAGNRRKDMYESVDKMVSHPPHYQAGNGMEVIDVIEAFTDGLNGIEATDTGNIIKYACRWKKKNGVQDLEKILWYTQHLIDHLKGGISDGSERRNEPWRCESRSGQEEKTADR
jgi:hypothetical protein